MNLRKAAEMALEALENVYGKGKRCEAAIEALRQALAHEALDEMVAENQRLGLYDETPHDKMSSKAQSVTLKVTPNVDNVYMSEKHVHKSDKSIHEPVAAHQALEALDELESCARGDEPFNHFAAPLIRQFIEQVLVKPEHEPFIYIREDTEMPFGGYEHCGQHEPGAFPVYTAPPKREWVGLTPHEVYVCWKSGDVVAAVEAKLKEKNGG